MNNQENIDPNFYENKIYQWYRDERYFDAELWKDAQDHINKEAAKRKHLKGRLISADTGITISRWASDDTHLNKICNQQKIAINPDAIFGKIDPRDTNMVVLKEMFSDGPGIKQKDLDRFQNMNHRGSSARNWNDISEFATPNIIEKAKKE